MTSSQIEQMYKIRMQNILNKNVKKKQDQLDKERNDQIKKDEFWGNINLAGSVANVGKDLFEWRQGKLLEMTYKEGSENIGGVPVPFTKYKLKEARPLKEVFTPKGVVESFKRATPIGTMEKTPEYEEFIKETKDISALDEALENLEAGTIDGEIPYLPEGGTLTASTDWMPMEIPEVAEEIPLEAPTVPDVTPEVEIPDAKPGALGKVSMLETGQTILQLTNIGKTVTNVDATDEEKGVASVQGAKLLTDLAVKRAGQEAVTKVGSKAATKFLTGKGLQEGVKLTGKQAVSSGLGAVLGGYTAVTEAEEAGEAWEEEDYDEAILHGFGSASGILQTAGGGMMATGIGAPLGAVLYGIGTAGSVLSSAGLFLEGLFGDGGEKEEAPKARFNASRFLDSIRS